MSFDEDLEERIRAVEVAESFKDMCLKDLEEVRFSLSTKITTISNKISDLAYNNYRTYADAGRTADHCVEMFTNINKEMIDVKHQYPRLLENIEGFAEFADKLHSEFVHLDEASSEACPVWEILSLPKMMDECIRAGQYDSAYALTSFALSVQHSKLGENPMISKILNSLIEARHGLLDVLFNKFAGPIDLAKSIQVVNNIRKIPYISNTQLRVSLLQYRDVYLEKNVLAAMNEPEYAVKIVDVYRDCMYDTIVLYLAVFPGADSHRSFASSDDPRWERWSGGSQNYLLQSWAHRNLDVMFERIRSSEQRSPVDLEAINGKLMSFAYSFGRMGMDFRPLIVSEISQIAMESFSRRICKVTDSFVSQHQLRLLDDDIFESSKSDIERTAALADADVISAPIEICVWDDLCAFGNGVIDALNDVRHFASPIFVNEVFTILSSSFEALFDWIDRFDDGEQTEDKKRARELVAVHFMPFMNSCFHTIFSHETAFRPVFKLAISNDGYVQKYNFVPKEYQSRVSPLRRSVRKSISTPPESPTAKNSTAISDVVAAGSLPESKDTTPVPTEFKESTPEMVTSKKSEARTPSSAEVVPEKLEEEPVEKKTLLPELVEPDSASLTASASPSHEMDSQMSEASVNDTEHPRDLETTQEENTQDSYTNSMPEADILSTQTQPSDLDNSHTEEWGWEAEAKKEKDEESGEGREEVSKKAD